MLGSPAAEASGRVLGAFFRRDLRLDLSYRVSFLLQAVDVVLALGSYFFLARVLREPSPGGYEPFPFLVVGVAVNGALTTCLICFAQGVRGGLETGTLKALLVSPLPPPQLLLFSAGYPLARSVLEAAVYVAVGALLGVSFAGANWGAALVVLVLGLCAVGAFGVLAATYTLLFKRGDPVIWLFGSLSWLLGGVFYPLDVLPAPLQSAAHLLPVTSAVEAMRATLLHGRTLFDVGPQLAALAAFVIAGIPLSLAVFAAGLRRARVTGSLGHL
jgi:ABC-2 type transport system permease protein